MSSVIFHESKYPERSTTGFKYKQSLIEDDSTKKSFVPGPGSYIGHQDTIG
jgi:hypothetical protein